LHVSFFRGGAQADPPLYRVTSLGELSGLIDGYSEAYGLNDLGQVVGETRTSYEHEGHPYGPVHAFLWLPVAAYGLEQGMHDLGVLPNQEAWDPQFLGEGRGINESGQIAGKSGENGFVWFPESFHGFPVKTLCELPEFDDLDPWEAWDLDDGDPLCVVGWGLDDTYPYGRSFGFRWYSDQPNQLTRVDPPGDDFEWDNSYIYGIRPDGGLRLVLAGRADYAGALGNFGAIGLDEFWGDTAVTLLLPWGMDAPRAQARDASDEGQLVGWGEDPDDPNYPNRDRALYWNLVTADPVNLHTETGIDDGDETRAEAIARPGGLPYVVGWNETSGSALLWKRDSQGQWSVEDLNELIGTHAQDDWDLVKAHDINNGTSFPGWGEFSGPWIVGWGLYGTYPNQKHRAFLLSTAKDCPHDLDFDGDIDTADLLILLGNWGYCLEGEICWSDIDMDGDVDTGDLLSLLGQWPQQCGGGSGEIPQTVQDCIDRFGFDPVALEACIQAVTGGLE
jgi:hypothetical protein